MDGSLKNNYQNILKKLELERQNQPELPSAQIIAVSKLQSVDKIRQLYSLGQKVFAENYVQEALDKQDQLKDLDIEWHFIGQLQSKKIKSVVGHFDLLHSVYRKKEIAMISELCAENKITQDYLLQINIAEEESKQGVRPQDIEAWMEEFTDWPDVRLRGFMIFPPLSDSELETLQWFKKSHDLFNDWKGLLGESFDILSMGTSGDYHLAYRMGATHLRIGEALMGSRK